MPRNPGFGSEYTINDGYEVVMENNVENINLGYQNLEHPASKSKYQGLRVYSEVPPEVPQ